MQLNDTVLLIIEILYILTVVSIVVVVISENRSPIKAVAWILAVMFLPVIGIIWYLIFGQDTTKKRVISKRMYSKLKRRPLDEMEDAADMEVGLDKGLKRHDNLIKLLKNLDYTPLLGGNDVQIFTHARDKFDQLFIDIEQAKHHIHLEYYVLLDDKIGTRLQQALIIKAKEGLRYALSTMASVSGKRRSVSSKSFEKRVSRPSLS